MITSRGEGSAAHRVPRVLVSPPVLRPRHATSKEVREL